MNMGEKTHVHQHVSSEISYLLVRGRTVLNVESYCQVGALIYVHFCCIHFLSYSVKIWQINVPIHKMVKSDYNS